MQKRTSKMKVITIIIAIVLSFCTIAGSLVLAKYLNKKESSGQIGTSNFYFTSNLLDGQTHTLAPGTKNFSFTIGNYADDLRFSEVDIQYTVSVTSGAIVENGTGELKKGAVNDKEVTISNLTAGTYEITAVGKGGYKKTLKATIVIPEETSNLYYYLDDSSSDYILLTVWNEGDKEGSVTIKYTGIPDNTNPNMSGWLTNESKTIEVSPHASMIFRFFGGTVDVTNAEPKGLN